MSQRLLVACLIASVALNAALVYGTVSLTLAEQALRLDPFELDHWAADPIAPFPPEGKKRVVIFGDSRARQWSSPQGLAAFEFVNRGVGFQTSAQVLGRFDSDVAALHPSIVVLQVGVNDLKATRAVRSAERCRGNLTRLVERSTAAGAHVVLSTIFSLGGLPWLRALYIPSETSQRIRQLNAALRTLASRDVSILDTQRILDDADGQVRSEYRRDFLHLNAAGYQALNRALLERVRDLAL
ncbi:MAG TPA: GDSL-type esterase/lipase family protein [Polyangiales bacterium]|nr:GDSL-type esterase/lipase family protein [Polyangiales bacterium]